MYAFDKNNEADVRGVVSYKLNMLEYLAEINEHCPLFPKQIYVGLTYSCNAKCIYCYRKTDVRLKKGFMARDLYKKIIDELAQYQSNVTFASGEPLLHKRVAEFVSYGKTKGLFMSIITNGIRLDDEASKQLIASGLDRISISFDSINPQHYGLHKPNVNHGRVLENILNFCRYNREIGSPVNVMVSTVKTPFNAGSIEETRDFFAGENLIDKFCVNDLQSVFGLIPISHMAKKRKEPGGIRCLAPWFVCNIDYTGRVSKCQADHFSNHFAGDVNKVPLAVIWNDDKMRDVRRALLDKDLDALGESGDFCKKCDAFFSYSVKGYRKHLIDFITENIFERIHLCGR